MRQEIIIAHAQGEYSDGKVFRYLTDETGMVLAPHGTDMTQVILTAVNNHRRPRRLLIWSVVKPPIREPRRH